MEIWLISASFIYILIQYQLFESVYNFVQIPSWDWIQKQSEINKKKNVFSMTRHGIIYFLCLLACGSTLEQLSVGVSETSKSMAYFSVLIICAFIF